MAAYGGAPTFGATPFTTGAQNTADIAREVLSSAPTPNRTTGNAGLGVGGASQQIISDRQLTAAQRVALAGIEQLARDAGFTPTAAQVALNDTEAAQAAEITRLRAELETSNARQAQFHTEGDVAKKQLSETMTKIQQCGEVLDAPAVRIATGANTQPRPGTTGRRVYPL